MLITNTFSSSKQQLAPNDCPSASSSKSTSTSSHRRAVTNTTFASKGSIESSKSSSVQALTSSEVTILNLFLRSSKSIAPLQIADIQGVIDEATGEQVIPAVRKGRIRTSTTSNNNNNTGIQCCIIESYPFDKCEIVATVVKKNAIYRQQGRQLYSGNNDKGKGRDPDGLEDDTPNKEEIQLIFYELDDNSGASITCCVNPAKVYAREITESKRRQASYTSRANGNANSEEYSTTDSDSPEDDSKDMSTPRASRMKRSEVDDDGDEDNDNTPRKPESKPKFDPRLWIYRYKSPPHPSPKASHTTVSNPSFEIPLFKEGTILRITGKIFINTARGNERQIEASSVECVYEEGYINQYRRKVPPKGNKYVEWHHAVKCRKKRMEYRDKEKVREMIGFGTSNSNDSMVSSHSRISEDVTMQDITLPSFSDSLNTTSTSHISSTSLLNATHLPINETTSTSSTTTTSANGTNKRKRAKLPSCSTLHKQKIPITKEIFSLYSHQYFRDLVKIAARDNRGSDSILPTAFEEAESRAPNDVRVTLAQMKEDKNLKWLAEIYARNEARRQAALTEQISISAKAEGGVAATPKSKHRHMSNAESSVILPSSSPSHSIYHRSTLRASASLQDTTNQSISSTSSKVKLKAEVVNKIRNDLFRSTILKLIKDGIIVVFPADLSSGPPSQTLAGPSSLASAQKRAEDCETCKVKLKKELDKIPPHLMTMDGVPLRQYTASLHAQQACDCTSSLSMAKQTSSQSQAEETYALLTANMLLPVVERIVARMDLANGIEVDNVWHAVRRTDDMWRFVNKEIVKECLQMI